MNKRNLILVILAGLCLTAALFSVIPVLSVLPYNPWMDVNDDGVIDGKDYVLVKKAIPSVGTPLDKAYLLFDSGWINITDKCGQPFNITHNLNSTDVIVDILGKTTLEDEVYQKHLGVVDHISGWNQTYGGPGNDWTWDMVQTSDGGYALAGETTSFSAGSYDFWLVKTDVSGNMQWNQTYGGESSDDGYALVQTGDGGYAMAGHTESYGGGNGDSWLVKIDSSGNAQWNKTYGGTDWDEAWALVQTSDGGYALAGCTGSFGAGFFDFWLVKTDATGNEQWNKTYGGEGDEQAFAVAQTGDGGYALTGLTGSFGAGSYDFWLVKTDAAGSMQWNQTYGGIDIDVAWDMVQTSDGGYALAGETLSFGAGSYDSWLVKTDVSGNMQWNQTYGGGSDDEAWALVQTSDGGYALAGQTSSFGVGYDFWLVKTDAAGNEQWNQTYGQTFNDYAFALVQTAGGSYALAGSSESYSGGFFHSHLVLTDTEVGLAWTGSTEDTITLYRGETDPYWNFVRVRFWAPK